MTQFYDGLAALAGHGKAAIASALSQIERAPDDPRTLALLDDAWANPRGVSLGLTGPPGVGKSTLVQVFIESWRSMSKSIAVIAVDPSSKRSRGALLGDRTRLKVDAEDDGVFIRSMAARDRLGGVADISFPTLTLLRAVFDFVVVETVGVGQSETEVEQITDAVALCVQPGSGDSLQYMKAGVAEIPDIIFVTKADLGALADRAVADMRGALSLSAQGSSADIFKLSARTGEGVEAAVEGVRSVFLDQPLGLYANRRAEQLSLFAEEKIITEFGRSGLELLKPNLNYAKQPFTQLAQLMGRLTVQLT